MNQLSSVVAKQEQTAVGVQASRRQHGLDMLLGQRAADELIRQRLDHALTGLNRLVAGRSAPEAA
jgi:hypothetical protein